ncbi:MAG: redox-sensing transcriptional repressor Rex [Candidatus Marinimicrobia bacterium]|nr:redox-sensing transcriptional repressor Rex [Candidatus Neomarinimicrobiota bacterium]
MDFHYDKISEAVIRRLTDYLRCIRIASSSGKTLLTSKDISETCGLKPSIIRKDLAQFGAYGIKGQGYNTHDLTRHLSKILGLNNIKNIILVGAGHLGTAIARYPGFLTANFNFIAAFDTSPKKIGSYIGHTKIYSIDKLNKYIEEQKIEIVVLAVPSNEAIGIVEKLDSNYVKGILNFTSMVFPGRMHDMYVHNIDLAKELEVISFCMKNCLA